jgi:hypothetical protein
MAGPASAASAPRPTTTSLRVSATSVAFDREQTERLTVQVKSKSGGTPTGQASIRIGAAAGCAGFLSKGVLTCTLPREVLPIGSYQLTAFYDGSPAFSGSTSGQRTLTVTRTPAIVSLALSTATVTFSHERAEHISVKVTGRTPGTTPVGKVTVKAGSTTVCTITLSRAASHAIAQGNCALAASKLRPGTYHLTASYPGDANYTRGTSAKKTLTVLKAA